MLNRIKQLKKIWTLTSKDPEYLKTIEELSDKEINSIPNAGNGKAVFIPLMSEDERDKYLRDQDPFWNKVYKKLSEVVK